MSSRPLLEAHLEEETEVPTSPEIRELKKTVSRLEREVANLKQAAADSAQKAVESLLRKLFSSLHQATSVLVGEAEVTSNSESDFWQSQKQKLGGKKAEVIQALQEYGEMSVPQLRMATKSGNQTIYDVTSFLFRLGLLKKNGGRYSLKQP